MDIIYWLRQIIGVFLGLIWGVIPLTGIFGLALYDILQCFVEYLNEHEKLIVMMFNCRFFLCNAGIMYLYFSGYHKVDEEEFGGAWELTKEGFMTSFAGFLVRQHAKKY